MEATISELRTGYGFLQDDDGSRVFFLASALQMFGPKFEDLGVGQRVEFTKIHGPKGPRAIEVKVLE